MDAIAFDRVSQRPNDMLLAHDLVEALRAMATVERRPGAHPSESTQDPSASFSCRARYSSNAALFWVSS
jgi:hypothetical protein